MNRWSAMSRAIALLAALVLAGCSVSQPSPSATPTAAPGVRIVRVTGIPDVHVPGTLAPVAGTADRFVIEGETNDQPGRYSLDNGRTWLAAPAELDLRASVEGSGYGTFIGYRGTFLGVRQAPEPDYSYTGFQRWDPATGQVTSYDYDLDPAPPAQDCDCEDAVFPVDYIGSMVLLDDSRIFDLSGATAVPVEPRLPEGVAEVHWRGLTRNGQYAVGTASGKGGRYLVLGALSPEAKPSAIRVPGLLTADVSADRAHYLTATADRLQLCRAETATPTTASCVRVSGGDFRGYTAELSVSDGADQIGAHGKRGDDDRRWFVRGGRATQVWRLAPGTNTAWNWLPFRDAAAPMALVLSNGAEPDMAVTLAPDGTATPLLAAPAVAASPASLAVAANRVAYQQQQLTATGATVRRIWSRSLVDGRLGEPVVVTDRPIAGLRVSGDRTAVQSDRHEADGDNSVVFYDGSMETGRLRPASTTTWLHSVSGPYARLEDDFKKVAQQIVGVDGHGYDTGLVTASFGSLVIETGDREEVPGRGFALRDLARPQAEPIPIDLPDAASRPYLNTRWAMWGEWLAASYEAFDRNPTVLFNYRTGEAVDLPAGSILLGLGDGWALLGEGSTSRVRLRVLATGEEILVTEDGGEVASDGVRTVAWSGLAGAEIATIEGLPAPVPRLLGALGASSFQADGAHAWAPQFDLTAPTGAGALLITDAAGKTVASLPVEAAPGGSIRGVEWDGHDDAGGLVAPGDYTWTLDVSGATSVDGMRPASGEVRITR